MTPFSENQLKQKVQTFVLSVSIILLVSKFLAYFWTHSVGILTDAMESIVNVIAGAIGLYSLYLSAKPKDKDHPFGHGKVELISASIEGLLILMAGGIIIYEGAHRFFTPAEIRSLDLGIAIVGVAGLINYLLGAYSIRMGKRHHSIALVAGGKHLQSDTYSSIGLVLGLLLLYWTGWQWVDSALAVVFGGIIALTGIGILRSTVANLMDEADKKYLQEVVDALSKEQEKDWVDIHNLKMIKYGSFFYIDCDLTLPWYYNVAQAHDTGERLKDVILAQFSDRVLFSVHTDSCEEAHCEHCLMEACAYRKQAFSEKLVFTLDELTQSDEERDLSRA